MWDEARFEKFKYLVDDVDNEVKFSHYMTISGSKSDVVSFKNLLEQRDDLLELAGGILDSYYFYMVGHDCQEFLKKILPQFKKIKLFVLVYPGRDNYVYELNYYNGVLIKYQRHDSDNPETEVIAKPYHDLLNPFSTMLKER